MLRLCLYKEDYKSELSVCRKGFYQKSWPRVTLSSQARRGPFVTAMEPNLPTGLRVNAQELGRFPGPQFPPVESGDDDSNLSLQVSGTRAIPYNPQILLSPLLLSLPLIFTSCFPGT